MSCPVTTEVTSSNTTSIATIPGMNSALMTTVQTISASLPGQQTVSTAATVDAATTQTVSSASSCGHQTALNASTIVTASTQIESAAASPGQQTPDTNFTAIAQIMSSSATGGNTTTQTVSQTSLSGQQTVSPSATSGTTTTQTVSQASSSGQQTVSSSATGGTTTTQTVSPASSSWQQTVSTSTASGSTTTQTVSPGSSSGQQTVSPAATSVSAATQTAMASRIDVTPEETNFLRFTSLVLKIGPRAVRHLFDLHNDPIHLDKIISDNRQKLENLLNNKIINKDHWSVLFPGNRHASSKKFDLTLMIAFLRDITGLKAPKSGWYRLPDTNDRSVGADLVRIKYYRNNVAHAVSCSVNTHDFNISWTDLSEAIIHLGGERFKSETSAMLCAALDASYQDLYRELNAMKEDIIPSNIKFLMDVKVQGMAMEDKTFISTRATNSVKDAVDQYGVVMVTGPPGSGKTATVNHIALQLQEQGYRICPVVSTKEIIEYWMPESPQVFIFNDPFGIHAINQSELHQWMNQQERLITCFQYSNMKILATIRSHIIEDEQISGNILPSSDLQTISLVNDESVLTDDERLKIFNAHANFKKRDDLKAMGVEIQNFSISCFPLLCRIYTSDKESKFSVKDFFQKPLSVISKDLNKFKINDPIRYFCLLYCMINDNNLDTDLLSINVESKTIETSRTILLEKCMVSTSLSREEIKSKMDTLLNTYLKLEGKCYHFIHDIIHHAVIRHVNDLPSDWKRIILQHCGPKFLNERIRLSSIHYAQTDGYLIFNSDLESAWNERILHDMIYDHLNWNYMVNNTTLFSEKADKLLLKSLESIDQKELQKLILSSHSCRTLFPILEASNKLKTIYGVRLDLNEVTLLHLFICLELKHCLEHILKTIPFKTLNQIRVNLLLVACILGKPDVVEVLLLNGYSANLCTPGDSSVLPLSSSLRNVEAVKVLLQHQAVLNLGDTKGQSPLHIASSHGHVEVVKVLLKHKAELDQCDTEGQSPLHIASSHGHVEVVKVLLEHKAKLDLCNNEGQSPLHIASSHGHVEVVKVLVEHKAKLDLCNNEGLLPLHVTSSHGHVEVVRVLWEYESKLDLCDNEGQSPLHVASSHGHVEVVKVLVENKAKLDLCDKEGQSPLHLASSHGHVEVVKVLLENKAKLDLCDKEGQSPLHIASSHGHVEVIKLLLKHKAEIDICDKEGQSPLNVASSHGHGVEILSFLRRHSIYGSSLLRDSPLFISSMSGHAEAVNLLLGYKANIRQRAKYGKIKIITPVKSNSDHSNLKVLRCRSPIEYLDCEDFNIKRSKEYFQFCKTFCGPQLYTQRELHRRLKHALNILDAKQEEENDVTLDNTLLSLSKCGKSSYGHLLLAYYMVQLGAHTKTADKYGNSNIHFAVQNSNVFLAILLLQNRDSVVMENTNVDVLKSVIDVHKKKCQHGNIWDKNTKCEHAVIARYISYLIAFQYQRKLSGNYKCLKVWPGYKHQDEISSYQGLHLVVQYDRVREGYSTTVSISPDIPVIWHNVCIVSTEGKYMNFKTQEHEDDEHLIRDFNNFRSIDKQTAKMLFKCHRNLNIISVSMLKSVGYGKNHKIIKKPCVTLYCDVKGIIPVGEEDFNSSLPGHVLDIREGHFSFVAGGRSHEYHDQLKMGCVIGTPKTFPNYGTLGGFVEHKGKTYLLTCAHVLFSIQELQRQTSQNMYDRKVVQPQDKNENEIGRVRKFRFPRNTDESETSVDAALVEISSRMPVDGTFPDDDLNNLYKAGYTDLPTFRSGEIKASIERADKRNQVVKFGAKTGLTIGNFNPHKDHVRIRNDDWWIREVQKQRWLIHHIQIFNQYEIAPLGNSTFADEGDSGSFVFTMKNNDENQLQCIGMVIGLTSAGTVLVTPISSILESLFLNANSLKTFDPSAIVERRHANHDPLIPNNVNGALDEGKRGVERRFLLFIVSFGVFILAVLFSAISK